jgi:hypothetical protein
MVLLFILLLLLAIWAMVQFGGVRRVETPEADAPQRKRKKAGTEAGASSSEMGDDGRSGSGMAGGGGLFGGGGATGSWGEGGNSSSGDGGGGDGGGGD